MTAAHRAPGAAILGLFHVAIKTSNLDATHAFWCKVLGLKEIARPDFGYPGAWLACPQPGGQAIIHVYAGGPALGPEGIAPAGTAAIDHLSVACLGFHDYVARFKAAGLAWREFIVPGTTLWQLFVYDPSGVQIELTFEGSIEGGTRTAADGTTTELPLPDMSPGRGYLAGATFFDPLKYPDLLTLLN
jgi:catechol 2,3-dioxygenase-like lactoylglutathione lyase family enzyme